MKPTIDEVTKILRGSYLSYQEPLKIAWEWNRTKDATLLEKSLRLLTGLKERYPHALQVRFERALALVALNRRPEALVELEQTGGEFPTLDEDTLCLWGNCFKRAGDEELGNTLPSEARSHYQDALDKYERAYALDRNRFPGINVATLQLVLASIAAELKQDEEVQGLTQKSEATARELLVTRAHWTKVLADDNIWIKATEAEARLLLREWDEAGKLYQAALKQPNVQPFHPASMRSQVERILEAFQRLGIPPAGPVTNLDTLFPVPESKPARRKGLP